MLKNVDVFTRYSPHNFASPLHKRGLKVISRTYSTILDMLNKKREIFQKIEIQKKIRYN